MSIHVERSNIASVIFQNPKFEDFLLFFNLRSRFTVVNWYARHPAFLFWYVIELFSWSEMGRIKKKKKTKKNERSKVCDGLIIKCEINWKGGCDRQADCSLAKISQRQTIAQTRPNWDCCGEASKCPRVLRIICKYSMCVIFVIVDRAPEEIDHSHHSCSGYFPDASEIKKVRLIFREY